MKFSGSIVALITPFKNGQLDEAALRHMVDWHIEQGTHALVPCGTTGESPTLSSKEHKRIIELVVEQTNKRLPVIAGAGSNNPAEAIEYTKHAQQAGADAVLHVAGYYNRPNQEGLYQHYKAIHDATEIPIIIYNIPPRAIVGVAVDTMSRLAELPRIVGVKDATGDLTRPAADRLAIKKEFSFLSGEDPSALAYNSMGGQGCISVSANIAPKLCAEFQNTCQAGKFSEALPLNDRLFPLHQVLFLEPSPAGVKYAASLIGLCSDECRLPIVPLSDDSKQKIKAVLKSLQLID